jgi:hypothetical protein
MCVISPPRLNAKMMLQQVLALLLPSQMDWNVGWPLRPCEMPHDATVS